MQLMELFFIGAATIWLFMPLVYCLLTRFTLDVKLTAQNKTSHKGNTRKSPSQLRASPD